MLNKQVELNGEFIQEVYFIFSDIVKPETNEDVYGVINGELTGVYDQDLTQEILDRIPSKMAFKNMLEVNNLLDVAKTNVWNPEIVDGAKGKERFYYAVSGALYLIGKDFEDADGIERNVIEETNKSEDPFGWDEPIIFMDAPFGYDF